jgi:hypothetical protein
MASPAFIFVTSVSTLLGLIAALYSLRLARLSLADGKRMGDGLNAVHNSLTTRPAGESPEYCKDVTQLVQGARKSIQITSVYPQIGLYLSPNGWLHLEHEIRDRIYQGVKVELLVSSERRRREALEVQFPHNSPAQWAQWSNGPVEKQRLQFFAKQYGFEKEAFDNCAEFIAFCLRMQRRVIEQVFARAVIEETDAFVPLITWVVDDREALFAIANIRGRNTGFMTKDRNLIASFQEVRLRYPRVTPAERARQSA